MANKLELTWVGKNEKINIEPRILIEDKSKSYGDNSGNVLIHGDNLLALKALENNYTNKIKCIYIDPPYNTGSAFEHYDDNIEHSIWLNLMKKRIDIFKKLLSDDGAICIQIDAVEMAYLKVIMDEIFGRNNFINIISVKTKIAGVSGSNLGKSLQDNIEYILFYAKDISKFNINVVPQKKQELMSYIDSYKEQGKSWKYTSVLRKIDEGKFVKEFKAGNGDTIKLFKHEEVEVCSINQLANELYNQMLKHFVRNEGIIKEEVFAEKPINYQSNYTYNIKKNLFDNYDSDRDGRITSILFDGIKRGVFDTAKFDSVPELQLAKIVERETNFVEKWLRPSPIDFNITYNDGKSYEPDFVIETAKIIYLVEVKGDDKLNDPDVLAKKQKSIEYCKLVSKWAEETGNKKWIHIFIPASKISSISTFKYLSEYYAVE